MLCKYNETIPMDVSTPSSIEGLEIVVMLNQTNAATALVPSDFLPLNSNVKITLTNAQGASVTVCNNNLQLLSIQTILRKKLQGFIAGIPLNASKSQCIFPCYINFGAPITLGKGDLLHIEVTFNANMISANVNQSTSFIDFYPRFSSSSSSVVPCFRFDVIQANASTLLQSLSNNTFDVKFINLDQTDYTAPVINTLALSSNQMNYSRIFYELIAEANSDLPDAVPFNTPTYNLPADLYFPQTLVLYTKAQHQHNFVPLTGGQINASLNGANVNASQNFIGSRYFISRK